MEYVRWGMIGCGQVTEVKSGPAFSKAEQSGLVAVMGRTYARAVDYAQRHGVPRVYERAEDLVDAPDLDAIYIATPPSSHLEFALMVAAARKACLVEKPMAIKYEDCVCMNDAFRAASVPLFVAYYRRALPRFLHVRKLLREGAVGTITSVHVLVTDQCGALSMSGGQTAKRWRFDPSIAGAGLFLDLGSHCIDLLDFLLGPINRVCGFAVNTAHAYTAEDVTAACFEFKSGSLGTGTWNFNADHVEDGILFVGSEGTLLTPVFTDGDIVLTSNGASEKIVYRNPPHVHQPLIQTIVDQLLGRGQCESTGDSAARTSWVMDRCLMSFYGER